MPDHKVHRYIDLALFNKSYWRIHRALDSAVRFLGYKHRQLYHDTASALAIAHHFYPGDPNAETAALIHLQIDRLCTSNPKYKAQLEKEAKLFARRKKRKRKRKRKAEDCPIYIGHCPCFICRTLKITSPPSAERLCPHSQ